MARAEPALAPSRRERLRDPLVVAAVVLAGTVALHLRDPHTSGSWGYCPWKLLTGLDCPACGSLRAVHDLTDGHLLAAAGSNLVFVLAVPLVVLAWTAWLRRSWLGRTRRPAPLLTTRVGWSAVVAVTLAFTVVRNTPWGSWLHS